MEKLKGKMSQELSKIEERTGKIDDELQEVQARTQTEDDVFVIHLLIMCVYIMCMYVCVCMYICVCVFYLDTFSLIYLSFWGFLKKKT